MRLYLSSFRLGDRSDLLVAMAGPGARVAVIANAIDNSSPDARREGVERELVALTELGLRPTEVDLREHFGNRTGVDAALDAHDVLWLRGGNVFMLRHALHCSGADDVIVTGLRRDAFVYAGYSAGPCVLAPSLRGLETVDDADAVTRVYGEPPLWDGLGVLDFAFVPHVASPDHPESGAGRGCRAVPRRRCAAPAAARRPGPGSRRRQHHGALISPRSPHLTPLSGALAQVLSRVSV